MCSCSSSIESTVSLNISDDISFLQIYPQCTRPDISFFVNLLAKYSSTATHRHWTVIKHIIRNLHGTTDLRIFYSYGRRDSSFVGYADLGYLFDPHKGRLQTGYVFLSGNATISWCYTQQTLVATSSNHVEI